MLALNIIQELKYIVTGIKQFITEDKWNIESVTY